MATIIQTAWAIGSNPTADAVEFGSATVTRISYVVTTALTSSHIVEMGILPAWCVPLYATTLITEGTLTGLTGNFGIMSGDVGSTDSARTVGAEFFSATDLTVPVTRPSIIGLKNVLAVDYDRSVGFAPSGNIAVATSKIITLELAYCARKV